MQRLVVLGAFVLAFGGVARAHQVGQSGTHGPPSVPAHGGALKPAEGAEVSIVVPAHGAVFAADEIPLHFTLVKGKRGEHVHAYVDGELMGMFKSDRGTLTGIEPGSHVLELRVAAEDHKTELDAVDRVEFAVE
jgi:hypothetical protein